MAGFNIFVANNVEQSGSYYTGTCGGSAYRHRYKHRRYRSAKRRNDNHVEQQSGNGGENVHNSHKNAVYPAAAVGCQSSYNNAEEGSCYGNRKSDAKRIFSAVNNTGKDVTAVVIGAEDVFGRGGSQTVCTVGNGVQLIINKKVSKQGKEQDDDKELLL